MASKDSRHRLGFAGRLRLLIRILGLTALPLIFVGAICAYAGVREHLGARPLDSLKEADLATLFKTNEPTVPQIGAWLILIGGGLIALWLLTEIILGVFGAAGRKSAVRGNAWVQIIFAIAIVVGLNFFAVQYSRKYDLTRDSKFSLPTSVVEELRQLQSKTTIVVLPQGKLFGELSQKRKLFGKTSSLPDPQELAAEQKITEKVLDLVDQFRVIGPQFEVITLSTREDFDAQYAAATRLRPGLAEALASAPDNSILFYADDRVKTVTQSEADKLLASGRKVSVSPNPSGEGQSLVYEGSVARLGFTEFLLLDKEASEKGPLGSDGKPNRNLVLLAQGIEGYARRVASVQEKKPKVAFLVVHEWLSTTVSDGFQENFTAAGLRKSLENYGFEVNDVILKRWGNGPPTPAVYNLEESRLERLEEEAASLDSDIAEVKEEIEKANSFIEVFRTRSLEELNRIFRARLRREIDEKERAKQIKFVTDAIVKYEERKKEIQTERAELEKKIEAILKDDRALANRRLSDVKAKFRQILDDSDLIIIPRLTLINTTDEDGMISARVHRLSEEQMSILRDVLKQGKPMLACLGPSIETGPTPPEETDLFEAMLTDRGVELGRQSVMYDVEKKAFAARKAGDLLGSGGAEIPPLEFPAPEGKKPATIWTALNLTEKAVGKKLELQLRHPRPVYLASGYENKFDYAPEFAFTNKACWNEEMPFITARNVGGQRVISIPKYEATPLDDAKYGTRDAERRGPFPVAVAIDSPLPIYWFEEEAQNRAAVASISQIGDPVGLMSIAETVNANFKANPVTKKLEPRTDRKKSRLVVIGSGNVFNGRDLKPANEQLLLHSCNWLIGRDARLPKNPESSLVETTETTTATNPVWQYPRVKFSQDKYGFWELGPWIGPPVLFLYLGAVVWLFRRLR